MRKKLVLMIVLVMTLSLTACGGETRDTGETVANPSAESVSDTVDWPYKDVTKEQIQEISDVLVELEPLYNEAASAATKNGWEADEITVQELNTIYVLIDAAQHGVADPSEYEGTEDMATVVEQYQVILGAMPDLIAKVSAPYAE